MSQLHAPSSMVTDVGCDAGEIARPPFGIFFSDTESEPVLGVFAAVPREDVAIVGTGEIVLECAAASNCVY